MRRGRHARFFAAQKDEGLMGGTVGSMLFFCLLNLALPSLSFPCDLPSLLTAPHHLVRAWSHRNVVHLCSWSPAPRAPSGACLAYILHSSSSDTMSVPCSALRWPNVSTPRRRCGQVLKAIYLPSLLFRACTCASLGSRPDLAVCPAVSQAWTLACLLVFGDCVASLPYCFSLCLDLS